MLFRLTLMLCSSLLLLAGCSRGIHPGPDRQFMETIKGAASGAASGAVTGAQIGAGSGPGLAVGAGIGAAAGMIRGIAFDITERELLEFQYQLKRESERAYAIQILKEHVERRAALYPTRDIFPADVFFVADETELREPAKAVLRELAAINKDRMPWSRLQVMSYVRSSEGETPYSRHLANERAASIMNALVKYGIEPRRIDARSVLLEAPLVLDPNDDPTRYNQVVEFRAADL